MALVRVEIYRFPVAFDRFVVTLQFLGAFVQAVVFRFSRLSALGSRLSALGSRLSAIGGLSHFCGSEGSSTSEWPRRKTEREILDRVERELLNENLFGEVLDIAVERLTREARETSALLAERGKLDRELGNLIAIAAAGGGDASTLVAEIKRREKRKAEIEPRTQPARSRS